MSTLVATTTRDRKIGVGGGLVSGRFLLSRRATLYDYSRRTNGALSTSHVNTRHRLGFCNSRVGHMSSIVSIGHNRLLHVGRLLRGHLNTSSVTAGCRCGSLVLHVGATLKMG